MEACIEALYAVDGEKDKQKTLQMIRVLKGAVSVSKSRTGQVIYRHNRLESQALHRVMTECDRDTLRFKIDIDCRKRDVLRKWNLVFGRRTKFCESMRSFDDMLEEALSTQRHTKLHAHDLGQQKAEVGKSKMQEENEEKEEKKNEVNKMPQIVDPRAQRLGGRRLDKQDVKPIVGVLPKLARSGGLLTEQDREENEKNQEAMKLPVFDKTLLQTYLLQQKSLHEDLLRRNALITIKSLMDKNHVFYKYRLKSRLPDNAPDLLQQIDRCRSIFCSGYDVAHVMTRKD